MFTLTAAGGWFGGANALERFEKVKAHGFKAIEILGWKDLNLDEYRAAIDKTGVEISAILIQSKDPAKQALIANEHGIVHEDAKDAFVDSIKETLEAAKALNVKNIVVTSGNERFDVPRKVQHDNIVEALKALIPVINGTGVQIVLEPLNILVNHMGYYLTTTAETAEIINEVNCPNIRILYDVYHQQITEGNIINNIKNHIDLIGHIHVGDVPGRREPGTGEINYKNVFKAIAETGYSKYVVFECGLSENVDIVSEKMWKLLEW